MSCCYSRSNNNVFNCHRSFQTGAIAIGSVFKMVSTPKQNKKERADSVKSFHFYFLTKKRKLTLAFSGFVTIREMKFKKKRKRISGVFGDNPARFICHFKNGCIWLWCSDLLSRNLVFRHELLLRQIKQQYFLFRLVIPNWRNCHWFRLYGKLVNIWCHLYIELTE